MLVFYCRITNYYTLNDSRQHTYILSQFLPIRSLGTTWLGPHSAGALVLSEAQLAKIDFHAPTGCWQNFLSAVVLRCLLSCWLSAGGCSQILGTAHSSLLPGFSVGYFPAWRLASSKSAREFLSPVC